MNRNQAATMLHLQAAMNARVNPEWLTAGYPYLRANVVEGGEAMEHYGWKWWKKQDKDVAQFRMELVDIWHFTLSHLLVEAGGMADIAAEAIRASLVNDYQTEGLMFDGKHYRYAAMDTVARLELLVGLSVSRRVSIPLFYSLMVDAELDWSELFRQYVSKNVLNVFRQDHGYKTGTYVKMWRRREDNEHLVEIALSLDANSPTFEADLYSGLKQRYEESITGDSES